MDTTIIHRGRGPEIAGTRITVYDVWDYLRIGWHHTEIAAVFGIASDQVKAAVQYIEEHREEVIDNYQRIVDRHQNHQYSPEVQARIAQAEARFDAQRMKLQAARDHANNHGG
jgi:uncharacterized protein (DUF433 family)